MATDVKKPEKIFKKQGLNCGIVIPISAYDGCPSSHWEEVRNILADAVNSIIEFSTSIKLVSEAQESNVIINNIVKNLEGMDVVICDISGGNPNVMIELGIRLALKKPTVIVKDDASKAPFDISHIEYIEYPRDLNYVQIQSFIKKLALKIVATHQSAIPDNEFLTSMNSFGKFKGAVLGEAIIDPNNKVLDMLTSIFDEIQDIKEQAKNQSNQPLKVEKLHAIDIKPDTDKKIQLAKTFLQYYYDKDPNIMFDYELITNPEFISEANKFIGEKIFESLSELELYIYLASKSFIYG